MVLISYVVEMFTANCSFVGNLNMTLCLQLASSSENDRFQRKKVKSESNIGGKEEGYLPFLTVSFVTLVQGRAPALMLALQLGHTSRVLLDQLAGLAVVFPN